MRWMGALLIIGATTAAGFIRAGRYTERCRLLEQWLSILTFLRTGIGYQAERLPQLFEKVAALARYPEIARIFRKAAKAVDFGSGNSVSDIWEQLLQEPEWDALHLSDRLILSELGQYLGATDYRDQVAKISACQERLRQNLNLAETESRKKVGICRYVGFVAGAAAVLLLL